MPSSQPSVKSAVSAARQAAFQILLTVERGQAHSDDLLRGRIVSPLTLQDHHLATTLVLGVLRWQIQLDGEIRQFLKRPNAKLDPEVRIALRLGAFQILHLDRIPARAAIDESVELTRQCGHKFASGMVNAVLRKLATIRPPATGAVRKGTSPGPDASSAEDTSPFASKADCSPAQAAHPVWMVDRWSAFFGADRTCAICLHNQQPPALSIRLATPENERELIEAGLTLLPGAIIAAARTVTGGDISAVPAFREGRVRIQDEGSQLVAELAAASIDPKIEGTKVENILDACAAPGGKTLILAERHPGARITACESNPSRLEKLRERMAQFALDVECRLTDATALEYESVFDLVLADVPCSGTGTLSRNPEIRHRLRPDDLTRQAERQRAILRAARRAVRPGGHVVYSTCSLEPEENEQVLAAILAEDSSSRLVSPLAAIESMLVDGVLLASSAGRLRAAITPEGYLRLFPGIFASDGFFIAILERGRRARRGENTPQAPS
jgi:16S rRNA (cytosine967-C5)-methyltransferase